MKNLKNKDNLKNEDGLINKEKLKNEGNLKNEEYVILKTVHSPSLYDLVVLFGWYWQNTINLIPEMMSNLEKGNFEFKFIFLNFSNNISNVWCWVQKIIKSLHRKRRSKQLWYWDQNKDNCIFSDGRWAAQKVRKAMSLCLSLISIRVIWVLLC